MLTLDEIEDSFEVAFQHAAEDLPDEQLQLMMGNVRELRRHAPPSLAVSQARIIIAAILDKRHPTPEPEPEPLPVADAPVPDDPVTAEAPLPAAPDEAAATEASERIATETEPAEQESEADTATAEDMAPPSPLRVTSPTLDLLTSPFRRAMTWFFGD